MAKVSKNQRSSIPPLPSRPSTSRRRSNYIRNPSRSDVYEYQSHKVRRAHIPLSLDRDEAHEHGAASDDDFDANIRKPRLIGENVEGEDIPSEDDEELDSDAAFEDTDEERFAGFSFPNSRAMTSRKNTSNSPETGSDGDGTTDSELGDSGDYIDVLDILDGRADQEVVSANRSHAESHGTGPSANAGAVEEKDTEEDEDEDDDSVLSANEDVNPSALEGLEKFVSSLETSKKRKGDNDLTNNPLSRKRRLVELEEKTAVGVEGEFTAVTSGQQLRIDDLIAPLASHSSAVLSLKNSVKILDASRTRGAPLSAPLPQRTQDRLDREAAYEQTKVEVDKWKETMQQIKEAEHLSFPLQEEPVGKVSNLELTAKFKPSTELEKAVDQLLKRAQMREEDLQKAEELKMNHLSTEEVASRRAEIMKTRELMFRAEMKAKRIARIKSKTYRRLKRRAKEKQLGEESGSEGPEAPLKREAERAKERATLRHKNTGKWAKTMRRRGAMDTDQRQDMVEMLERGEKLRRKIQGSKEGSDSDDDNGDSDDLAQLKAQVFDELAELKRDDSGPAKDKGKSIFDMKFMQDAAAREQREVDKMVDNLMEELQDSDAPAHEDEADSPELPQDDPSVTVQRTGGRISLRPCGRISILAQGSAPSDVSSTTLKSTDVHSLATATPTVSPVGSQTLTVTQSQVSQQPSHDHNPWLCRDDPPQHTAPKKNEVAVSKDSTSAVKAKNKLRKRQRETKDEVTKVQDDGVLEISPEDLLVASFKERRQAQPPEDSSDGDGEVEEQEERLKRKGKHPGKTYHAFQQRELVTRAFAGDNVVEEFEEAKSREVEEDAPHEVDTSLPGWGAWGGQGTRKTAPKPHLIKKIAGIDPQSRADFGKAHVIISEKRDKKAAKYLTKDLPYPYTSKAQFERNLEAPIGKEWNTRIATQRATLPKVTKKMGAIIRPLEKRF